MKKSFFITLCSVLALAACANDERPYNEYDFANGGEDAPFYNERVGGTMTADNQYAEIDSYRPISEAEKEERNKKWTTARMETRWQEYKGTMVRVQILLGNSDLREMRLRLMQNADGTDIDANMRTVLDRVADYEMKRVCGKNASAIAVVYDIPSFETMRPTPFFDYRIEADGASMREYGFRCVYEQ